MDEANRSRFLVLFVSIGLLLLFYLLIMQWPTLVPQLGIRPRSWSGLVGIVFSPLLHQEIGHLLSNCIALVVNTALLISSYREKSGPVVLWAWVISGTGTWLIGRGAIHHGASGVVYGITFFILFSGFFTFNRRLTAVSFIVCLLYGHTVWGIIPQGGQISWEGHLSGALAGIILAFFYRSRLVAEQPFFRQAWMRRPIDYTGIDESKSGEPEAWQKFLTSYQLLHLEIPVNTAYQEAWQKYKMAWNFCWAVGLLVILSSFFASAEKSILLHLTTWRMIFNTGGLSFLALGFYLLFWSCPRCGRFYHLGFSYRSTPYRCCLNCGLPQFSLNDADQLVVAEELEPKSETF